MTNEQVTGMLQFLMQNAEMEFQTTKRVFAAIPEDKLDFTLGEKGRSTLALAQHIAASDVWFLDGILKKSFADMAVETDAGSTAKEIVAWYSEKFPELAAKVKALPPEHLATPVDFFGMCNLPAVMYLSFLANHMIHHRGQLSTYLRAMNAYVPSIYGPSADEQMPAATA